MKKQDIGTDDYKGSNLEKSFSVREPMSFEKAEKIINNNFERGLIDKSTFEKALDELYSLRKGKKEKE